MKEGGVRCDGVLKRYSRLKHIGVHACFSGRQCDSSHLSGLRAPHIDADGVLLSDVVMPGLGGFELSSAIRETRPGIKVIMMSGYPSRGEIMAFKLPEDVPLLQKPLDPDTLTRNVRDMLDGRKLSGG